MSTRDQVLSAALHGEALLAAKRAELQPLVDHLRAVAQGRDDIRTECAGIIAGSWFSGAARRGEDLIAAGLLMLAGPVDLDELDRWCVLVGNVGGSLRAVPGEQLAPHPRGPTAGIPDLRHQAEPAVFPTVTSAPPAAPAAPRISCVASWLSVRGRANLAQRAADGLVTTKKSHQHHRIHGDPPNQDQFL